MGQEKSNRKKQFNNFIKLSGIGIQIGAIIYIFSYIGGEIDLYLNTNSKTYTLIMVIVGFLLSMVSLVMRLNSINKEDEE